MASLALASLSCAVDDGRVAGPGADAPPPPAIDYTRDVLPILDAHCFACHGANEVTRRGDIALHALPYATAPTGHGQPIVPGHPEQSLLIASIRDPNADTRMPPDAPPLTTDELATLYRWIREGAHYVSWSLTPPVRPSLPAGATNPVDGFVRAALAERGVDPSPPADSVTLVRRVTLDLTGLPPTPEEVDAFVADPSDAAYEAMVDRLLASPRHAEHLAHDWLDVAGYGDSDGVYFDEERWTWGWRDWVIDAFDRDLPLDDFVVAQLAGDMLPGATDMDRLATGFLRTPPTTEEGGVIHQEYLLQYARARAQVVGTAFLGLTVQCATCHDHKYDPITQRDFYELTDCFNHTADRFQTRAGFESDGMPTSSAPSGLRQRDRDDTRTALAAARASLSAMSTDPAQTSWEATLGAGPIVWSAPHVVRATTALGTSIAIDGTGLVTATGASPFVEGWLLDVDTPTTIDAIRLTTGPPRSSDVGAAQLSEIDAWIDASDHRRLVRFERATKLDGTEVGEIIDGRTSTALATPTPIVIVLAPAEPIVLAAGETLRLRIDARARAYQTYASMRIEASSDPRAALSDPELATLAQPPGGRSIVDRATLTAAFRRLFAPSTTRDVAQQASMLQARAAELAGSPAMRVMAEDGDASRDGDPDLPRETHILVRGQYDAPGDRVHCGIPSALTRGEPTRPVIANRLELARWLVSDRSPTTARVLANHYFRFVMGRGLSNTPGDLGAMGDLPSHPELLDWLAVELRESGWNLDALLRVLVTSATYRQSSVVRAELDAIDPGNRMLSRASRFRLDAEVIHDQALAVSGLLVEHLGGPSVRPYHPELLYEAVSDHPDAFLTTYRPDRSMDAIHRRGLYVFWRRATPMPSLALLDEPDRVAPVAQRDRTDTPTQALALMNDPLFVEAARHLAERVRSERPGDVDAQITRAFRLCNARVPTGDELSLLRSAYDAERSSASADPSVLGVLSVGDSPRDSAGDPVAHAAMTLVAQVILSSSETLTRE